MDPDETDGRSSGSRLHGRVGGGGRSRFINQRGEMREAAAALRLAAHGPVNTGRGGHMSAAQRLAHGPVVFGITHADDHVSRSFPHVSRSARSFSESLASMAILWPKCEWFAIAIYAALAK